jgi:hypothetical protein
MKTLVDINTHECKLKTKNKALGKRSEEPQSGNKTETEELIIWLCLLYLLAIGPTSYM